MISADYLAGSVALILIVLPWVFASPRVLGRLLPDWTGCAAVLGGAIIAVSGVLVVAELLGIVGAFSRWPMAAASAGVAVGCGVIAGRAGPVEHADTEPSRIATSRRWAALALAAFCVLGVSAALLGRDARSLHTGPIDTDSVHYHLTESAYFVQSHDIDHLHQTGSSDPSVYYPFDQELLDAVAMLGPHPDLAVLTLNVGFGSLALLACWVIGARWEMAPAAVAAGASVLALPLVAGASSGPGLNDIPSLALLLAAVAVVAHAGGRPQRWLAVSALAGLALGIAGGSKLSLLAPVVLIALTLVVLAPARRLVTAGVVAGTALVTGGFWYVRDWIAVATPVPNLNLTIAGHGLHGVPYPQVKPYAFAVTHYLTNGHVIRHWFIPQLKVIFTPLWPLVVVLGVTGVLLSLARPGDLLRRLLAVTAVVGFAVYVATPTTALGPPDQPILFGANVRYAIPVIALSMLLAATWPPLRRFPTVVTAGFTALTFILLGSSTLDRYVARTTGWALAAVVAAGVAWCAVGLGQRTPRKVAATTIAVVVALGAVGAAVQHHYVRQRYAATDSLDRLYAWAATVRGQRIGVVGYPRMYPFFGPTFANQVAYVGVSAADRSFAAPTTCPGWRSALAAGRFNDVVVQPLAFEHTTRLLGWTTSLPGSRVVFRDGSGTIVALPATIGDQGCQATP